MMRAAKPGKPSIAIVNPLGGTLLHYTAALAQLLRDEGCEVTIRSVNEPSVKDTSRIAWVLQYMRAVALSARPLLSSSQPLLIVTWPVLGYLDVLALATLRILKIDVHVVMHDPEPLVRATGYTDLWRSLARLVMNRAGLIIHSRSAQDVLARQGLAAQAVLLPHPILPAESLRTSVRGRTVRVLGQYKPDRDVELLERIAAAAAGQLELEIWGRGWPSVEGWDVHSEYLSEDQLDDLLRGARAIVVPYRRFYQSGIAIRALECGTPFVGPADSSLADLYEIPTPLLIEAEKLHIAERWLLALKAAENMKDEDLAGLTHTAVERTSRAWRRWLYPLENLS